LIAQLDGAGIIDSRGRIHRVEPFRSHKNWRPCSANTSTGTRPTGPASDRIMPYAETTACRARVIAECFGERATRDRGRCDSCRTAAKRVVTTWHDLPGNNAARADWDAVNHAQLRSTPAAAASVRLSAWEGAAGTGAAPPEIPDSDVTQR
jgi:hypothetical protein